MGRRGFLRLVNLCIFAAILNHKQYISSRDMSLNSDLPKLKNIVLLGAGLHANNCIDIIEKQGGYKIIGIIDSLSEPGTEHYGYQIIGRQEDLVTLVDKYNIHGGIICVSDNLERKFVRDFIVSLIPDFHFVSAIHPFTSIGRNTTIGAGAIVNAECVIEDFAILNTGARLEHDGFSGEFARIIRKREPGKKVLRAM